MVKNFLKSPDFDLAAVWISSVHTASSNCFSLGVFPSLNPLQLFLCWKNKLNKLLRVGQYLVSPGLWNHRMMRVGRDL